MDELTPEELAELQELRGELGNQVELKDSIDPGALSPEETAELASLRAEMGQAGDPFSNTPLNLQDVQNKSAPSSFPIDGLVSSMATGGINSLIGEGAVPAFTAGTAMTGSPIGGAAATALYLMGASELANKYVTGPLQESITGEKERPLSSDLLETAGGPALKGGMKLAEKIPVVGPAVKGINQMLQGPANSMATKADRLRAKALGANSSSSFEYDILNKGKGLAPKAPGGFLRSEVEDAMNTVNGAGKLRGVFTREGGADQLRTLAHAKGEELGGFLKAADELASVAGTSFTFSPQKVAQDIQTFFDDEILAAGLEDGPARNVFSAFVEDLKSIHPQPTLREVQDLKLKWQGRTNFNSKAPVPPAGTLARLKVSAILRDMVNTGYDEVIKTSMAKAGTNPNVNAVMAKYPYMLRGIQTNTNPVEDINKILSANHVLTEATERGLAENATGGNMLTKIMQHGLAAGIGNQVIPGAGLVLGPAGLAAAQSSVGRSTRAMGNDVLSNIIGPITRGAALGPNIESLTQPPIPPPITGLPSEKDRNLPDPKDRELWLANLENMRKKGQLDPYILAEQGSRFAKGDFSLIEPKPPRPTSGKVQLREQVGGQMQ